MAVVMYIVPALLLLVVSFGVGFIINMLAKKFPWTSTVVALALGTYWFFAFENWVYKLFVIPILVGGYVATYVIRTLQQRGFKMFQS
ncbi:MAG: hypothetical protein ACXVP5_07855 [Tumebacillaceae bacterium]